MFCWFHQLTETHTKFLACLLSSKLSLLLFARPPRHWCLPYTLCRCLGGAGKRCPFAQGSPSRWGSSKGGSLLCLFSRSRVLSDSPPARGRTSALCRFLTRFETDDSFFCPNFLPFFSLPLHPTILPSSSYVPNPSISLAI